MRRPKPPRCDAGFTLIEVLLALGILAGAMFVLLDVHYGALRLSNAMRDETTRRLLMEQAAGMAEMELLAGNMSGSGDFGERFPDLAYSFEAAAVSQDQQPGLYAMDVSVTDKEGEGTVLHVLAFVPGVKSE